MLKKSPVDVEDLIEQGSPTSEDEMVREHHQLNGHESEETPGDSRASWWLTR